MNKNLYDYMEAKTVNLENLIEDFYEELSKNQLLAEKEKHLKNDIFNTMEHLLRKKKYASSKTKIQNYLKAVVENKFNNGFYDADLDLTDLVIIEKF